jgi:hypothetical protein
MEDHMNLEELEANVKRLEKELGLLRDVEEIRKLQYIYGYYFDNRMIDDVMDLFSDDTELVEIGNVYLGKTGARKVFEGMFGGRLYGSNNKEVPGILLLHPQIQGVITVDPDGITAKGRWRCLYYTATPIQGELRAVFGHGHYENEYVKENGKWKFKKFQFFVTFRTPWEDGWVKTPIIGLPTPNMIPEEMKPDRPGTIRPYPSGDVVPFHYKHPITGR